MFFYYRTVANLVFLFFFVNKVLYAQDVPYDSKTIDSSFILLQNRLEKAKMMKHAPHLVEAYIGVADFYKNLGIANEAIQHYHKALEIHHQKDTTLVYINNNLAAIHLSLKQFETAKDYLQKSLSVVEQIHFERGKATSFSLLGTIAEKKSEYPLALKYQEQSLTIFERLLDSTGLAVTYENIGSIYEDLEKYDKAFVFFNRAYSYANNSPSNTKINILNNLGDANRKSGNLKEALYITEKALLMAKLMQNEHQEASALKDLAQVYFDMGEYKMAFNYLDEHEKVKELEVQHRNMELVSTLLVLYKLNEREAEVKLLNQQNEINKIRQNVILLASTLVVLVLAGWIFYFKKKKQQASKIHHFEQKLLKADLDKKTSEEVALHREISFKLSALTNYSLQLAHKDKMLSDISRTLFNLQDRNIEMIKPKLKALVNDIEFDLAQEQEWTEFIGFFEQIHPNFFQNLKSTSLSELSPAELRLCMLLKLNLPSKEIASILRITPDSVRIARYRLRKKLPLTSLVELQAFILNL